MPTPEELIEEAYTWRVCYRDGTELFEANLCEHGTAPAGEAHRWACVDLEAAVSIEFMVDAGPTVRVDTSAPGVEPMFFRRRVREYGEWREAPDGGAEMQDLGLRADLGSTWMGYRVKRAGVTVAEAFLVALADGTLELRPDSARPHDPAILPGQYEPRGPGA